MSALRDELNRIEDPDEKAALIEVAAAIRQEVIRECIAVVERIGAEYAGSRDRNTEASNHTQARACEDLRIAVGRAADALREMEGA